MNEITAKVEYITPDMASEYLRHNHGNRPLKKANIQSYAKMMKAGKWDLNGETIKFDKDGTLIDGQNRLHAIILADVGVHILVIRGLEHDSFFSIDQGANRTNADIFSCKDVLNYTGVSTAVHRYVVFLNGSQTALYNDGNKRGGGTRMSVTKRELYDIYTQYPDLFQRAALFARNLTKKYVRVMTPAEVSGFISFAVINLHYDIDFVCDYFEQLFSTKTNCNHIALLYRRFVQSHFNDNKKLSGAFRTNLFAKSWNMFVKGTDTKVLKWSQDEGKIEFLINPNEDKQTKR